jgi:hypothetical protein
MKAVFGGLLLAAAVAAADAKAEPEPEPQRARSSSTAISSRYHPVQVWGGIGYYNTGLSQCFGAFCATDSRGQFGFNGGGSYAVPINPDVSWLGFGNIALAFGDVTSFPITVGGGIRGEHLGPVQLSGLAGLSLVPISGGAGTKVGLALGPQVNLPIPQVMPRLGVQAAFMYHVLTDSFHLWTLNAGVSYVLPY